MRAGRFCDEGACVNCARSRPGDSISGHNHYKSVVRLEDNSYSFCECMCMLWGDRSHSVVAVCVYLSTSLQGSLVCCVLTCE